MSKKEEIKEEKKVKKSKVKTEKKVTKKNTKVEKKKNKKESIFQGVKAELSKVVWPSGKDITKYTIATIVLCLLLMTYFIGIDALSTFIKGLF